MQADVILNKFKSLPVNAQQEVIDFLEFLVIKYKRKNTKRQLNFDWEGGLAGIKENYNSVELQHLIKDYR